MRLYKKVEISKNVPFYTYPLDIDISRSFENIKI